MAHLKTRKEQKDATRRLIIRAAEKLFAARGITQTTTADIARAVKLSHGAVFVHFPSREALVVAVIEAFGARLSQAFAEQVSGDLEGVLRSHLAVLADYE